MIGNSINITILENSMGDLTEIIRKDPTKITTLVPCEVDDELYFSTTQRLMRCGVLPISVKTYVMSGNPKHETINSKTKFVLKFDQYLQVRSITPDVDYFIYDLESCRGDKLQKARDFGLSIFTYEEFIEKYS